MPHYSSKQGWISIGIKFPLDLVGNQKKMSPKIPTGQDLNVSFRGTPGVKKPTTYILWNMVTYNSLLCVLSC